MAITKIPTELIDTTSHMDFLDGEKLRLGTSNDLQLYHDASNSYINDTGTGALYIKSNYLAVAGANGHQLINAEQGAAVELFHNNTRRLSTSSTGITVTGDISGTTATASGGTSTTALASTAFVQQELTTLIGGAPSTLNDLNELAAAINDDANYNSTLTTALATKLPLAGGTMSGDIFINGGSTTERNLRIQNTGNTLYIGVEGASGNRFVGSSTGNAFFGTTTDSGLEFATHNNVRMYIDGDGKVGIGTTSPYSGATLSVAGSTVLANGNQFVIGTFGTSGLQLIGTAGGDNIVGTMGSSEPLLFRTASAERMRIDSSGHVGIRTTPSAWGTTYGVLDLNTGGSIYGTTSGVSTASNLYFTGSAWLTKSTGLGTLYAQHTGKHLWYSSASASAGSSAALSQKMELDASGNLGIGITPFSWSDLMVHTATNRNISIFDNAAGATICAITDAGASTATRLAGSPLLFTGAGGSGGEHMRIDSSGNLLVGKSNTTFSNYGIELRSGNLGARFIRSNAEPVVMNRVGGDGRILGLYFAGNEIGYLGSNTTAGQTLLDISSEADANSNIRFLTYGSSSHNEVMRLTSAGNVLVGTTSTAIATTSSETGTQISDGGISIAADNPVAQFNRISSDGAIVNLRKNGSTIGSLGNDGTDLTINSQGGMLKLFLAGSRNYNFDTVRFYPQTDNARDLGAPSVRFKDLHLSGTANAYRAHIKTASSGASADVSADELVVESNGNAGISILSGQSNSGSIYFGDAGVNYDGYIAYAQATRSMTFGTAAGSRMTIDSSGRVGINRTPSISNSKLEVGGADNVSLINVEASGNTGGMGIGSTGLQFFHGSSSKMTIDASGNVGIGTASPTNTLDLGVATQGRALTFAKYSNVFSEYSNGSLWLSSNFYGNAGASGYKAGATGNFGAAGIRVHGTGGGGNSGIIQFYTDTNSSKTADATYIPKERMRIDENGKVGIGTDTPTTKLQVNGASDSRVLIYETGTSPYTATLELSSQVIGTYGAIVQYTSAAETLTIQNYGRAVSAGSSTGSIAFKTKVSNTTPTDVMFIHGFTGNVGIGTTAPDAKLDIRSSGTSTYPLLIKSSDNQQLFRFREESDSRGTFHINDASENSKVTLASSGSSSFMGGKVGIGTTNPYSQLEITGMAGDVYTPTYFNNVPAITIKHANTNGHYGGIRFTNAVGNYEKFIGSAQTSSDTADIVFQGYDRAATAYKEYVRIKEDGAMSYGGNTGVYEKYFSGTVLGNATVSHDITHADDSSVGTILRVEAAMTHHPSYDCILDTWVSRRGSSFSHHQQFRRDTGFSGAWSVTYVSSTVTRISKSAGSYGGGGPYWIKVTWRNV